MTSASSPAGPSLAGRFAAAIALTIGFYVLALVVVAGCLAVSILPWVVNGRNNLWLTVIGVFLAFSVLSALIPRRLKFAPDGVRIGAADQPRLFALIDEEVASANEAAPDRVYATLQVNAAVTEVGGDRVMEVGLPLLHMLSERELRSVIAHELGHYAGGDTRLGPWIYRTRETIVRTIQRLTKENDGMWSRRIVRKPFIWYGNAFLRTTNAISRRQEFAADARAALAAGRDAQVSALRRIHAYGAAFDGYWMNEVVPVLDAKRRPPIADGFRRFIADDSVERQAQEILQRELAEGTTSPYDSHPSLPERIAAVQELPAGEPDASAPAISLVDDPDALERAILDTLLGDQAGDFRPIAWDDVGRGVYVERARHLTGEFPDVVRGRTVGELAEAVEAIPRTAEDLRGPQDEPEYVANLVAAVLADGAIAALERAGWEIEAPPARPIAARRGDDVLVPHHIVHELRTRELSAGAWRERSTALGIADLPLAPEPKPAESPAVA
jgi:heat shock protein HtpX